MITRRLRLAEADVSMEPGRRIAVLGTSGSGKTYLARGLAATMGVPHVELDALHWGPNWTEVPDEVMRERVEHALAGEGWTCDGNYRVVRDLVWGRADTLVWLDYSLPVIMRRLVWRTFSRAFTQEELWSGNRESMRTALLSRDSILLWALQTYRGHRKHYPALFRQPEYAYLKVIRFQSPRDADRWLQALRARHSTGG